MVLPCTDGRVDKTAKEEDKADEQYDTGHATVKSVSFSHTGCLTHKKVPWSMSHAVDGTYIKAQQDKMVNSSLCKKASVDTYFNVMEVNLIIYNDDVIMMN